jgi:hypothetical protein
MERKISFRRQHHGSVRKLLSAVQSFAKRFAKVEQPPGICLISPYIDRIEWRLHRKLLQAQTARCQLRCGSKYTIHIDALEGYFILLDYIYSKFTIIYQLIQLRRRSACEKNGGTVSQDTLGSKQELDVRLAFSLQIYNDEVKGIRRARSTCSAARTPRY